MYITNVVIFEPQRQKRDRDSSVGIATGFSPDSQMIVFAGGGGEILRNRADRPWGQMVV
jgi:hypothetical protein